MRDKFTFFKSYGDALEKLPDEERLKCYDAIFRYAIYDEEPKLEGIADGFFTLMKPNIDSSINRAENGKKGGRPKAEEEPNENQTETKVKPNHNQTETKPKANEKLTESKSKPNKDMDMDMEEDKEKDNTLSIERAREGTEAYDFEKAWDRTFDLYPKKRDAVSAKTAWMKVLAESVDPVVVARLIYGALKMYLEHYSYENPHDDDYRFLPKFDKWMTDECEYWIKKYERRKMDDG